jgi:phosphatidylglycerophosphatase A
MFGTLSYVALHHFFPDQLNIILIILSIIFTYLGTIACKLMEPEWGHDPSRVVMDETVGQWITYLFIPFSIKWALVGLALFRFFDILKPLGIRSIDEKMKHPFSVMLDDIVAGVYALITLHGIIYLTGL